MGRAWVFFYVVECFPVNLEKFAANAVGGQQAVGGDEQVQRDAGILAIALGKTMHKVNQVGALDAERAKIRHEMTKLRRLVMDGLLEAGDAGRGVFRRGGRLAAQDVELNLDTEKGMKKAVVPGAGTAVSSGL